MSLDRLSIVNPQKLKHIATSLNITRKPFKFNNQDYWQIKRECLKEKKLFIDDTFDLNESIMNIKELENVIIKWQRPHSITSKPVFKIKNSRGVIQGILGNCWLVASFASLVAQSNLWRKVVPYVHAQTFNKNDDYAGIFVFRFWHFGFWIEVVIDDLLPTVGNKLAFAHSENENEFWCALVEKAYAKLNSGYSNLEGGHVEALIHFSGGVPEYIEFKNKECSQSNFDFIWNKIMQAVKNKSLMTTCIEARNVDDYEKELPNGLIMGHSYAVTYAIQLTLNDVEHRLIRLTNPWRKKEWKGNWCKNSNLWKHVTKNFKRKMNFISIENGEFYMSFVDFYKEFSEIVICHNLNTNCFKLTTTYAESSVYDYWRKPDRCGGCLNYKNNSFLANPQYRFDVVNKNGDLVIISLTQKNKRSDWKFGAKNLHVGFCIIPIEFNRIIRISSIENETKIIDTPLHNSESIMLSVRLAYGRYCIIPHTYKQNDEGEFFLRVFTQKYNHLKELESTYKPGILNLFSIPPQCITQICVKGGINLLYSKYSTFIVISCENEHLKSSICKPINNPKWNISAVFYRYNYQINPITISLFRVKYIGFLKIEKLIGRVFMTAEPNDLKLEFLATLPVNNNLQMTAINGVVKSMRHPFAL